MLGPVPVYLSHRQPQLPRDGVGQGLVAGDARSILPRAVADDLLGLEVEAGIVAVQTSEEELREDEQSRPLARCT